MQASTIPHSIPLCLCSTPGSSYCSYCKSGGEACHCCGHYTSRDTCHGKCPPPAYIHAYVSMSPITSQPSPPLPHPLPPDSGGDMPEEWRGSDALHLPSPGGSTLLFYVVGLRISLDHAQKYLVLVSKGIWYHQELYRVLQNPCNTVLDPRAK